MTKCKVIALANQKGGTAKTTTALGWTNADSLPITLETQMKKILQDEPFVYCKKSQ